MGVRHGGRQKGTPNKRSQDAIELMRSLNFDPLAAMVEIAQDPTNSPELRGRMCAELARFAYPTLKAVEHTTLVEHEADPAAAQAATDQLREMLDGIARNKIALGEEEERLAVEKAELARMRAVRQGGPVH